MNLISPILALCLVAINPPISMADDTPSSTGTEAAFDKAPEPVGGMAEFYKFVEYPEAARKDGTEGTVLISATIGSDGTVTKSNVQQSARADLDRAAAKAVGAAKWIPAQKNGKPVESTVVIPIRFTLHEKKK